jgi:signal transduction histidine kinase
MLRQAPVPMLMVDWELKVVEGNEAFWRCVDASEPAPFGTLLGDAIPQELSVIFQEGLLRARESGEPTSVEGVRLYSQGEEQRILDLHITPAQMGDRRVLIVAASTVPDTGLRLAELTLLHDMARVLRQETELERVLFTTLTCATASGGMAFNRAFVLLVDPAREWLEGRMAIGPGSAEEAHRIWSEISAQPRTLEDFAAAYDLWARAAERPLQDLASRMHFSMEQDGERVPVLAALQRRSVKIDDAQSDPRVSEELRELLGAREFVVAPMTVADESCGVIVADNLYSGRPITYGDIRLLSLFAQHAGMAIESAQAYHAIEARGHELEQAYARLKETQDELVKAEKLAAIGEMAARVAHDFRNPIVTIGGWAEDLVEEPDDPRAVLRASEVIRQEARSLETILSMLVEPLASREVRLEPTDLSQLLRETVTAQEPALRQRGIELSMALSDEVPMISGDRAQLRRAIVNLVDNAAGAMPDGGTLSVRAGRSDSEIWFQLADTGAGMSREVSSQIFNPFFSTQGYGSGLGLAIVWETVNSHGWTIEVDSELGKGTVFTVRVPLGQPEGATAPQS